MAAAAWKVLRDHHVRVAPEELARWMAGEEGQAPPPGFTEGQRAELLSRQAAYRAWLSRDMGRPDLLPRKAEHRHLGYRRTLRLEGRSFDVHVIGLDSAWAAGGNDDSGRLLLTDEQVARLALDASGDALPGFSSLVRMVAAWARSRSVPRSPKCRRRLMRT